MSHCVLCGVEHTRLFHGEPAMYCDECAAIRKNLKRVGTQILDTLYLGDVLAAAEFTGERLCVYDTPPSYTGMHHHIPILAKRPNSPTDRTGALVSIPQLDLAADLIAHCVSTGTPLFVHCMAGIERSPLTVAHFLVRSGRQTSLEEAYRFLKRLRPAIADRRSWLP